MKNLLIPFMVIIGTVMVEGQGESIIAGTNSVKFFGVDFSEVKVFGAKETPAEFLQAFEDINNLIFEQPDRYNFEKLFNRKVSEVSVKAVNFVIDYIDREELKTEDSSYVLDDKTIVEIIKFLPVDKEDGIGAVMIAEIFNRTEWSASYIVVYFSLDNKDILGSFRVVGKASGFGLRNFWASTISNIIRRR